MNDYIETRVDLTPCHDFMPDLLCAALADAGYESFITDENGLTAYIPLNGFSREAVDSLIAAVAGNTSTTAKTTHTHIEGRDWNAEWEQNHFTPIVVDNECVIHSSAHTDYPRNLRYDIVINPRMAFGTGHHATTTLILRRLLNADLEGRSLIDVGTGTGILAILAAMRGAVPVSAIEIDAFAWENAVDNVRQNGHPEIAVLHGDAALLAALHPADYVVANINRNIVVADMPRYAEALRPGGTLILSGFYEADAPIVSAAAVATGLEPLDHSTLDRWASLAVRRPNT